MKQAFDSDQLTDMEIALSLMRLIDVHGDSCGLNKAQKTSNVMSTCTRMVESAIGKFTNPYAKNLLIAKLAEQGQ